MSRSSIKEVIKNVQQRIDDYRDRNARITNEITMLSLNATIDAARAGEAGRSVPTIP